MKKIVVLFAFFISFFVLFDNEKVEASETRLKFVPVASNWADDDLNTKTNVSGQSLYFNLGKFHTQDYGKKLNRVRVYSSGLTTFVDKMAVGEYIGGKYVESSFGELLGNGIDSGVVYADYAFDYTINSSSAIVLLIQNAGGTYYFHEIELYSGTVDLKAPSEISDFSYSFDDDLNLSLKYTLPVESDFSHLKIYKNSDLIESNYKLNELKLNGISPLESNQFRIVSVDHSGNESSGFIQTVVAPDGPDFVAPQNILGLKHKVTGNAIQFNYIMPTDDDFSHLQIYRNNELIIENHKINSFSDTELKYESNYSYVFKSVDTSGNVSEGVSIATVTGKEIDLEAPSVPKGLTVKSGNSALYVTWSPNSETDIAGYNIFVNDVKYNGTVISGNSFTIPNLENSKVYDIKVSAVDTSSNESGKTAGLNGVPDQKAMPIVQVKNNLGSVATSTENWFAELWLPLAFGVSIPLAFIIGSRVKSLFLS